MKVLIFGGVRMKMRWFRTRHDRQAGESKCIGMNPLPGTFDSVDTGNRAGRVFFFSSSIGDNPVHRILPVWNSGSMVVSCWLSWNQMFLTSERIRADDGFHFHIVTRWILLVSTLKSKISQSFINIHSEQICCACCLLLVQWLLTSHSNWAILGCLCVHDHLNQGIGDNDKSDGHHAGSSTLSENHFHNENSKQQRSYNHLRQQLHRNHQSHEIMTEQSTSTNSLSNHLLSMFRSGK